MVLAFVLAQAVDTGPQVALIGAISALAVAVVTGLFAVIKARADQSVRYLDPPTSHELPRALSDLLEEALADARKARDETTRAVRRAELWESRARKLGWRE